MGAHPGVTASIHLSNQAHRSHSALPCGSCGPAAPALLGSGPISGITLFAFDKSHRKGREKEVRGREGGIKRGGKPWGEQALPCQGSRCVCWVKAQCGAGWEAVWALRVCASKTSVSTWKPGPERVSGSAKSHSRSWLAPLCPSWPGIDRHKLSCSDVSCGPVHSHTCSAPPTADTPPWIPPIIWNIRGLCPFY